MSLTHDPSTAPPDPRPPSPTGRSIVLPAIGGALLGGVATVVVLTSTSGPSHGIDIEDEFTAEISHMNARSICVADRPGVDDDEGGTCGIPIEVDRGTVEIGDTVLVTTMWLPDGDGTSYEAWYVRRVD